MSAIGIISVIACLLTFTNVQKRILNSNKDFLQLTQNQLDNYLPQIDKHFSRYWTSEFCFKVLGNARAEDPVETYAVAMADNITWMKELASDFDYIGGAFSYFRNIDLAQFRGYRDEDVQRYLSNLFYGQGEEINGWQLTELGGSVYFINVRKSGNQICGVWIPLNQMCKKLKLDTETQDGNVFFMDGGGERIFVSGKDEKTEEKRTNRDDTDYLAEHVENGIAIGDRIERAKLYREIPGAIYVLLAVSLCSLFLIPLVIHWLKFRISQPIIEIDRVMQIVGNGNIDYRILISEGKTYDEFDRLSERINQTLDELNDISYNLYETEIKAQRSRIRYLTEQIRPHFILNALNIIYTYDESEFYLIKKMVLYLTEYFRYIVNVRKDFVKVIDEMHHVQNYLNIQKERYQNRFDSFVEWEVATEQMYLPPLIIQTFVENCIKYGMKDDDLTFIYVLAKVENNHLKLMIADTGNGFAQEILDKFNAFCETGEHQENLGVGMETIVEGMNLIYGKDGYKIELVNALSGGAIVYVTLPVKMEE